MSDKDRPRTDPDMERTGMHPADAENRTWPAEEPQPSKNRTRGGSMDQQPWRQFQEATGEGVHDASAGGRDRDSAGRRRRDGE